MSSDYRPCTKDELVEFVKAYPRRLERDVDTTCEPPLITYNDFSLGDWPESIVAAYCADGGHYYTRPPNTPTDPIDTKERTTVSQRGKYAKVVDFGALVAAVGAKEAILKMLYASGESLDSLRAHYAPGTDKRAWFEWGAARGEPIAKALMELLEGAQ